jgi:hypothetical protein
MPSAVSDVSNNSAHQSVQIAELFIFFKSEWFWLPLFYMIPQESHWNQFLQ